MASTKLLFPENVPSLASAPGSPTNGMSYYDTTLNAYRVYSNSAWINVGSGGSGDIVSTLVNAEVSITTTTTATINKMHVCSGTSANYTVSLPSPSGNTGKPLGLRMSTDLTKLVTIDAGAGVTINGKSTTLNGSITNVATTLTVNSAAGFPSSNQFAIQIDSELLVVTAGMGTTTWTVRRGVNGTTAVSHSNAAIVDWNRTRVMWANEAVTLLCDGSNWYKLASNNVPMQCNMARASFLSAGSGLVNIPMDTTISDPTGIMADPTTNKGIIVARTGTYLLIGTASYSLAANMTNAQAKLIINGTAVRNKADNGLSGGNITPQCVHTAILAAGDVFTLATYMSSASYSFYVTAPYENQISLQELP